MRRVSAACSLAVVAALSVSVPSAALEAPFTDVKVATLTNYDCGFTGYTATECKNDVSGLATVQGFVFAVDDTFTTALRVWPIDTDERQTGYWLPLDQDHKDAEAASQLPDGKTILITSSMTGYTPATGSVPANDNPLYNYVSSYEVSLNATGFPVLNNPKHRLMRPTIMSWLQKYGAKFPGWYERISVMSEKTGNLNIEGLSYSGHNSKYDLVWGLRSPLMSATFATGSGANQVLDNGNALLVFAKGVLDPNVATGDIQYRIVEVNLNGKGVRSMEWIPALNGYLISAGPVPKADNYALWLYQPDPLDESRYTLTEMTSLLPQFSQLGRPEGILNRNPSQFAIYSEQDPHFTSVPAVDNIVSVTMTRTGVLTYGTNMPLTTGLLSEVTRAQGAEAAETTRALGAESAETTRAKGAESTETTRALTAESTESTRAQTAESAESTRALGAESALSASVSSETTRAQTAETSETSRAQTAEAAISATVTSENSRAVSAEQSLTAMVASLTARVAALESVQPAFVFGGLSANAAYTSRILGGSYTFARGENEVNAVLEFDTILSQASTSVTLTNGNTFTITAPGLYRFDAFIHLCDGVGSPTTGSVGWIVGGTASTLLGPNFLTPVRSGPGVGGLNPRSPGVIPAQGENTFISTLYRVTDASPAAPFTAQVKLFSTRTIGTVYVTDSSTVSVTQLH